MSLPRPVPVAISRPDPRPSQQSSRTPCSAESAIASGHKTLLGTPVRFVAIAGLVLGAAGHVQAGEGARPFADPARWVIEQMPGGTVTRRGDALEISDKAGCTVWWREKLTAPVAISYDVTVLARGGPNDRVSDVNCFWMARDSRSPAAPFAPGNARSGRFSDYDSLFTYYVGYGGNNNTTTRFRRYDGTAARPLLPEHDLAAPRFLLQPNRVLHVRLVARRGQAEFWCDGERVFAFTDPAPLTEGWFALRTVNSHLLIENLRIEALPPE